MTEPTPIDLPVGLRWVKLVCRLGRLVTDSAADADAHPDLLPVGGTLTLAASPSRVRIQEADGRWRSVEVAGRTYTIRADGELVDNEGRVGVYIPDPASLLVEPQGYAITAVVKPTAGTDWRVTVGGDTVLPDVVDLVAVSSVGSASPSVTASFDARLYALEQGGGVDVSQAVEDYLTANPPAAGLDTEAAQDVVGAMIVGAGGTYDDNAGTITLPSGSGAASAYYALPASSGAITLNPANGDRQGVTLTGPATFTFAGDGQFSLAINRSTSGHAATFEGVTWETPPNIAAGTNVLSFVKFGTQWFGFCSGIGFDTEAPTAPGNLQQGSTTTSSVELTWTASTDNIAIDGYEVSVDGGAWVDVFKVLTYTLTALTPGQTYTVQVRARDIKFNRSTPATLTVTTTAASGDTTAPTAGTLAASAISETGFTLTVSGASDAVGLDASPYSFDTGSGTFGAWQASNVLAVADKDAGTAYSVRHRVRDAAGNITVGSTITVTTTSAAFDPASIQGMSLWLKSESLAGLTDGDSITSWTDSSGNANHAVAGGDAIPAPTKSSSNGYPAATFVSGGSVLASPAQALTPEGTMFAVVRRTGGAQTRIVGANLQGFRMGTGGTNQWTAFVQTTGGTADSVMSTPTGTAPINTWHAVGARFTDAGDSLTIRWNSASPQSTTATKQITGTGTTTLIGNGSISVAFDPFQGEIVEVLRYGAALTDTEMGDVLGYLRSKYGIA